MFTVSQHMMTEAKLDHAGDGLQTLQGMTPAREVLAGLGCGWEPCVVILRSN